MIIYDCKTDHLVDPMGYAMRSPSFSWKVKEARGSRIHWTRIRIAADRGMRHLLYDSGKLPNADYLAFRPAISIEPYTRYWWTVEVMSDAGEQAISQVCFFETAKMEAPWAAQWIGCPEGDVQSPIFEKTFTVASCPDARLYISGLGLYEATLDGRRIGDELLAPGCTDYNRWIQYQTYELPLEAGEHTLAIQLGNGWYKGRFGLTGSEGVYGDAFGAIAEIRASGQLLLKTDASWHFRKSGILENNFYDGEVFSPACETLEGSPVAILPWRTDRLSERLSVPVRIHAVRCPVILKTPKGECVLDFGQNMTGFVRFHAHEPSGARICLEYGEVLQDGCFYNENYRSARAAYTYISDGQYHDITPRFTDYGFRYVRVTGLTQPPEAYGFEACAITSVLAATGSLKTGHPKVNQLLSNIAWGQLDNYVDVPTDCPQRDERLGWTGDTQMFAGTACFLRNSYPFLRKYMYDMWQTWQELGCIPNVIPAFEEKNPTCAAWGDAATIIPWTLYRFYGDSSILELSWDCMKAWSDYMAEEDRKAGQTHIWRPEFGFGDWLAMDHDNPEERMLGGTDLAYISTAFYYYSTLLTAKAGEILGKPEAGHYLKRAEAIRKSFSDEFITPNGRIAVTTQTGYVLALYMGLVPETARANVARELHEKLERCQGRLQTGFIGTAYICQVLSENGYHEDACRLLMNEGIPGWLYAVNLGATTVWERWNSMLPDGHVNGTDMNSFNHYAYGSVAGWMYRALAGISPLEPGFRKARIAPQPYYKLKHLDMAFESATGQYRVQWVFHGKEALEIRVSIPFPAEAEVILPYGGGTHLLKSGEYDWRINLEGWQIGGAPTELPFILLKKNSQATAILQELAPACMHLPDTFCRDSLRKLATTPFVQLDEEVLTAIDQAVRALNIDFD